jgi:hypothetical protein
MKIRITGIFLLLFVAPTFAQSSNPAFEATCKDDNTHGYRSANDFQGNSIGGGWTTNEKFNSTWQFRFTPPDKLLIDNKPAYILAQKTGLMIAAEAPAENSNSAGVWTYAIHLGMKKAEAPAENSNSAGVWTYAIHLGMKKIVASQVLVS